MPKVKSLTPSQNRHRDKVAKAIMKEGRKGNPWAIAAAEEEKRAKKRKRKKK